MPPLLEFPLMRGVFAFQADKSSTFVDRAASKFQAFPFIFTFDATQTYPLASRAMIFFTSRSRHTKFDCDWSSDVCSSDLQRPAKGRRDNLLAERLRLREP